MSVRIISDSTCDLSKELIEKYHVNILPLHVVLGDMEYKDGQEVTPEEIYRWSDEHKTTPRTSAPALEDAVSLIRACAEKGGEVICFSISDQMSTAGNVMRMAAAELELEDRVFVIDSANLSTGVGLLVIRAAELAGEGKCAKKIVEAVEALKPYVRASFVVDTLTYLYRGGRCSGLAALAGSALKLHPKIVVEDGRMSPTRKYRGNISKVIINYAKDLEEQLQNARSERVFITHSGCGEEIIEAVRRYLESLDIFEEILVTRAGGVISSHCGPGTLGVLFIEKSE